MQMCKISNSSFVASLKLPQDNQKSNLLNHHSSYCFDLSSKEKREARALDFLRVSEKGEFQASREALQALDLLSSTKKEDSSVSDCKLESIKPLREIFDEKGRLVEQMAIDGSVHYSIHYRNNLTEILNELTGEVHTVERNDQGHLIRETYPSGLEVLYAWNGDALSEITMPDQSRILYLEKEGYYAVIQRVSREGDLLFQQSIRMSQSEGVEISLFDESPLIKAVYDPETNCLTTKSETLCLIEQFDSESHLVSKTYKDPVNGDEKTHFCPSGDLLVNRKRKLDEQNRVILANGWKCKYDEKGRLIEKSSSKEAISYQYDALDRLTHVQKGSLEIEYTYDFLGRCLSKTEREKGETSKEFYIYHGMNEIGVYNERKDPLHVQIPAVPIHAYICLASHIESQGKTYIPLYDSNFNIAQLIETQTKEAHSYQNLDPFAENLSELNPICPWIYQGKHFDKDTGFINFIHRQYDPSIQQWTSKDPDSGIDSEELYTYCNNNPYHYMDPDGQFTISIGFVARCTRTGASLGGFWGGILGAATGVMIGIGGEKLLKKIDEKMNNEDPNKQYKDAAKAVEKKLGRKLKPEELDQLHDLVTGQGYGYHEMVDEGFHFFDDRYRNN